MNPIHCHVLRVANDEEYSSVTRGGVGYLLSCDLAKVRLRWRSGKAHARRAWWVGGDTDVGEPHVAKGSLLKAHGKAEQETAKRWLWESTEGRGTTIPPARMTTKSRGIRTTKQSPQQPSPRRGGSCTKNVANLMKSGGSGYRTICSTSFDRLSRRVTTKEGRQVQHLKGVP
jgi:hypothetical protein